MKKIRRRKIIVTKNELVIIKKDDANFPVCPLCRKPLLNGKIPNEFATTVISDGKVKNESKNK